MLQLECDYISEKTRHYSSVQCNTAPRLRRLDYLFCKIHKRIHYTLEVVKFACSFGCLNELVQGLYGGGGGGKSAFVHIKRIYE